MDKMVDLVLRIHAQDVPFQAQFHELVVWVGLSERYAAYRRSVAELARRHLQAHPAELGHRDVDTAAVVSVDLLSAFMRTAVQHVPQKLTDPEFVSEVAGVLREYLLIRERASPDEAVAAVDARGSL